MPSKILIILEYTYEHNYKQKEDSAVLKVSGHRNATRVHFYSDLL